MWLIPGHGQGVGERAVPLSLLAGVLRAIASYLHWEDALQRQRCSLISDVLCHAVVGTPDFQPLISLPVLWTLPQADLCLRVLTPL